MAIDRKKFSFVVEIDGVEFKGFKRIERPDFDGIEGKIIPTGTITLKLEPDPDREEKFYRFLLESGAWPHAGQA